MRDESYRYVLVKFVPKGTIRDESYRYVPVKFVPKGMIRDESYRYVPVKFVPKGMIRDEFYRYVYDKGRKLQVRTSKIRPYPREYSTLSMYLSTSLAS
jgi:hypothetical protein